MAVDPVRALADRLAPTLRQRFLSAVQQLQGRVSLDALIAAMARGGVAVKLDEALARWPEDLRPAVATVNEVFARAVALTEDELTQRYRLQVRFDLVNPRAVAAAEQVTARLVREVTEQTQQAIRTVIARAISQGIPPREAAHLIRPLIGLTERQAMAVINYRFNLLEAGGDGESVAKAAERYAANLLRQRAVTIARTETIRAGAAGRRATWAEAKAAGYLDDRARERWVTANDERLCPICEDLDGAEIEPGGTFPGGYDGPPAHPSCRCTTTLVIHRRTTAAA